MIGAVGGLIAGLTVALLFSIWLCFVSALLCICAALYLSIYSYGTCQKQQLGDYAAALLR